ncbi:hypothetical protein ACFPIJ_51005 [Dactylosporangium cerinum]|uniref:SseB protein N-terminal domain-containing protein n=1 Tax=Dactylosporangium cerinum TaxID=1434730 RepID=A0ABV9WFQ3_9ACTN
MSDSPLSDAMGEHAATRSPESYERFLALFRAGTVGIVAIGTPETDASGRLVTGSNLGAGRTTYGDGKARILTFADPETALRNFGPRFNAGLSGADVLQMVATNADCDGILVNSATEEISLVISKSTAQSLVETEPPRRRWWNRR